MLDQHPALPPPQKRIPHISILSCGDLRSGGGLSYEVCYKWQQVLSCCFAKSGWREVHHTTSISLQVCIVLTVSISGRNLNARVWIPDTLGVMCEFINLPCFLLKSTKYYIWKHNQKRRLPEKITFLEGCQGDDGEAVLVEWRDRRVLCIFLTGK